ncbi:MAG: Holliday junction resolvase [Methanobrevibacter sp.]|jgi:Holliday junction resolvase|nr:Holliday junction resolvase [Candidatus Methanovirga basalitermitum]
MVKKGSKEERDLVHIFWDKGFAAMRAPASGGATKRPLPDVLAGNSKKYLAIEVKTTTKDLIYIDSSQINGLYEFCKIFGAEPYLGVKFKQTKWLFLNIETITKTRSKNYKVNKNLALEKGLDIDEIIGKDRQVKLKL